MNTVKQTDDRGRHYMAREGDDGLTIRIGPPDGLVDSFGLPEPFATELHNALFRNGIYGYEDARKKPNMVQGALTEAYRVDTGRLVEAFLNFEREVQNG